jgi:tRNA(Ile)-lysidine synthase
MSAPLTRQVARVLREHRLAAPGAHVVAAVSGGADSTALLLALHTLARNGCPALTAAHLHHGLRGRAADAEARFVRALCRTLGVRCVVGRAAVRARARRRGESIEMAARAARYAFLKRTAHRVGATHVATGHTRDDQAETVLLKLARGAGPEGLSGIAPCTVLSGKPGSEDMRLIRPLLDVSRAEVEAFLRARGQDWCEDASNASRDHLRNRVRHDVLPLLETALNPAVRDALARTADILRAENAWLDAQARRVCPPGGTLTVRDLAAQPAALRRRVVRLWLGARGVDPDRIDFETVARIERLAATARGTRSVDLPGGWSVRRRYGRLDVARRETAEPFRIALALPGVTDLPLAGVRVRAEIAPGIVRERGTPGVAPARASLSRKAVGRRRIYARAWAPGDRMRPLGMAGSRKLQDIFTDARVPADRRARIPVFECGGEIVWIPGYRIARAWAVPDAETAAVQLSVDPLPSTFRSRGGQPLPDLLTCAS